MVSHPIKNYNNELVSSTDEELKAWHSHYIFLGLSSSGHSLFKDYWKDSDALRNLGSPRQKEWDINQGICDKEVSEAISSMPNFKACGPDGIPMEFFKALIPCKDNSEESSENNSNISSGFKCLKAFINSIFRDSISYDFFAIIFNPLLIREMPR